VLVSCYAKLGWGPGLENLTGAAARFRTKHGLFEWMLGRDGQLILTAEVDSARAARLVRDFYDEVMRSNEIWRVVPIIRSYCVVNPPASWFLVATSRPWGPDDSFSRCIVTEDPLLSHVGAAPPRFENGDKTGMCIWRGPEPVQREVSSPREEERVDDEPLFSPEGDPPDLFEIEEQ
jgi:hypothetical protein